MSLDSSSSLIATAILDTLFAVSPYRYSASLTSAFAHANTSQKLFIVHSLKICRILAALRHRDSARYVPETLPASLALTSAPLIFHRTLLLYLEPEFGSNHSARS